MSYRRENWALGMSSVGLVLGPVGIGVGLFLAFTSRRWTLPQKWAILMIPAALVGISFVIGGAGGYTCTQIGDGPKTCESHPSPVVPLLTLVALIATAVLTAVYLFRTARRSTVR